MGGYYYERFFDVYGCAAIKDEVVKYVATKRMGTPVLNKKGEPTGEVIPVEWELKAVDSETDELLRKECTKKVPIQGKRGQYTQEVDTDKYTGRLCVASTVYPDLNNAELQDSYGVKSGDALLKKMLKPGEYLDYKTKVMEVNGYDLSMEDLVDEAKN